ncbi:acyl-CoA carboxylase subunit beta [Amycolatopsis alkalitolerans]|uniref:Propionyl-CoA carboxylase n=1 Tax=Amycolatopsis alkalitolerans TaxID=2547244 RepID=A0A5C4M2B6_9PSEU|nr:carboxyl transferase domain-containing protein [Amycolatopsis alkalitolerans]TNC25159.1 propionyl-CoA carboxylase [Amycolatopsis alkalitolerans]
MNAPIGGNRPQEPATRNVPVGTSAAGPNGEPWWVAQLKSRSWFAEQLGGADKVARQHERGRKSVRERIDLLVDPGTFREIGKFTGAAEYDAEGNLLNVTPSNVVTGTGRVGGHEVVIVAEDFTVRGGSSESTNPDKWQYAERLALEYRMPLVRLVETAGGSVNLLKQMSSTKIPGYRDWPFVAQLGYVPVIGVALGAAAGLGAIRVCASHFSVMTENTSYVFAGGPAVVKAAVGEDVTPHQLGGSQVHARGSGVVDNEAADEAGAISQARRFLSYLPSNVYETPPVAESSDPVDRQDDFLATVIPGAKRQAYDMRRILKSVFDKDSIFEIGRYNGRSEITCLARLGGHPVAVLASDPMHMGGALTAQSAEKLIRFVDMADSFHIPIINFVDQPGTMVGTTAEAAGAVRKGIRAQMAIEQAGVPWATIFVRRAYGLAGSAYAPLCRAINWRLAWPTAHWGSIPIEGGVEAAYRRELSEAADPESLRKQLYAELSPIENPFLTAERFAIQDIIDPRTTRPRLCEWIVQAYRLLPELLGPVRRTMRS